MRVAAASKPSEPTVEDVFALLELLLGQSKIRLDRAARPVVFSVASQRWRFDPKTKPLFQKQKSAEQDGVLELRCEPQLLIRLIKEPSFSLGDADEISYQGELEDLLPIATALEEGASVLNVRSMR